MNVLLWVLQAVLALLYLSGQWTELPRAGWSALGVFEMVGAVLLIAPAATKWMPVLTPLAAAALALETLILAALYASRSLQLAVTNPLVWAAVMGVLAALLAYGRWSLRPLV
jgi:hypothetical protein